eukprot:1116610-Lingulodinium_polyedra.AAC.1
MPSFLGIDALRHLPQVADTEIRQVGLSPQGEQPSCRASVAAGGIHVAEQGHATTAPCSQVPMRQ